MSDRKRKHAESSIIKETVSIKRKKISAEAAAIRKNSPKNGKPKKHVERGNTSGRKWKHLRDTKTSTNEVVTMDDEDLDEHTKLLTSVTGKMQRLPLYDDGQSQQREREEGEMKEQVAGVSGEEKGLESKKGVTKEAASQYLQLWNSNRDKWTFKKKTQYWLLQNMFDKKKVSKANFKLLLLYLDGLRGNQRGLVRERAEKVAAQTKSEKDTISESKTKYKRASQVLRILE